MPYTLNLYSAACQLYLNRTEGGGEIFKRKCFSRKENDQSAAVTSMSKMESWQLKRCCWFLSLNPGLEVPHKQKKD